MEYWGVFLFEVYITIFCYVAYTWCCHGFLKLEKAIDVIRTMTCRVKLLVPYLRFQEIAGALDSALMTNTLVPSQNSSSDQEHSHTLVLKQSISLMDSLRLCWRDDVFIVSCSDKFLRLFLQLLSRSVYIYLAWTRNSYFKFGILAWTNISLLENPNFVTDVGTRTGYQLDWMLAKLVMQMPILDPNGLLLLPRMISSMYVSHGSNALWCFYVKWYCQDYSSSFL